MQNREELLYDNYMARLTIEIDTNNLSSVLETYLMLGRLLKFWKHNLSAVKKEEDDTKSVQQTTEKGESETQS